MSRRRGMLLVGVLVLAWLGAARPAVAQTPVYAVSAADTALDPALVREIELARMRGVPAAPLLAKVREGRLKRAPGSRIRVAVAALATRLDSARAALGGRATPEEIVAGADALAAGASPAALRAVRGAAAARPVAAPLGALAQLVASGVPAERALAMIVELLNRHATPAQVLAFGNSVESDAAGGVPADESAVFRLQGIAPPGQTGVAATNATEAPVSTLGAKQSPPPVTRAPKRRP
jgi:hypothetical protein